MNERQPVFHGPYGERGTKDRTAKVNGNKGVMRARRAEKRAEAEARNAQTYPPHRRANARKFGYSRTTHIPAGRIEEYIAFAMSLANHPSNGM